MHPVNYTHTTVIEWIRNNKFDMKNTNNIFITFQVCVQNRTLSNQLHRPYSLVCTYDLYTNAALYRKSGPLNIVSRTSHISLWPVNAVFCYIIFHLQVKSIFNTHGYEYTWMSPASVWTSTDNGFNWWHVQEKSEWFYFPHKSKVAYIIAPLLHLL